MKLEFHILLGVPRRGPLWCEFSAVNGIGLSVPVTGSR